MGGSKSWWGTLMVPHFDKLTVGPRQGPGRRGIWTSAVLVLTLEKYHGVYKALRDSLEEQGR